MRGMDMDIEQLIICLYENKRRQDALAHLFTATINPDGTLKRDQAGVVCH